MDDIVRHVIGGAFTVPIARVVERVLLVDLKAIAALNEAYHAQRIHYLKAFGPGLDSLLNFGTKRLEIERIANTG